MFMEVVQHYMRLNHNTTVPGTTPPTKIVARAPLALKPQDHAALQQQIVAVDGTSVNVFSSASGPLKFQRVAKKDLGKLERTWKGQVWGLRERRATGRRVQALTLRTSHHFLQFLSLVASAPLHRCTVRYE